jgi:hypothetical protein
VRSYSEQRIIRASEVAAELRGKRGSGGNFVCRCPGPLHRNGDRNPSLSVKDGRDGKLLLFCHAGCSFEEIVAALPARLRP